MSKPFYYNTDFNKGILQSGQFNAIQASIYADIDDLIAKNNGNTEAITQFIRSIIYENFYLQDHIASLENTLYNLESIINSRLGTEYFNRMRAHIGYNNNIVTSNNVYIDNIYNTVSIAPNELPISKLSVKDINNNVYIPDTLQINVTEYLNGTGDPNYSATRDTNTKLDNMVDGNIGTCWERRVVTANTVNYVTACIHIIFPQRIMNNLLSNVIKLSPYPEYGVTITDIQYKGLTNTWYRLSTYPTTNNSPDEIASCSNIKFAFDQVNMTELKIFIKQSNKTMYGSTNEFVYGMRNLDVEYMPITLNTGEFVSKFTLADIGRQFSVVNRPSAIISPYTPQNINDLVDFKLYYNNDLLDEFQFGSQIVANIDTVYVKTILKKNGNTFPTLSGIELEYLPKA